ncbi:MAG: type II toxin-antitoxin system death-on-curing family toxin [Fimbriimonadaceae bacterium]
MTRYLTTIEVLSMHSDQISRHGGSDGLRDMGLVEAALFRPQTGYYADIFEEAAALWESLSQSHPFIDGNKRTAFAATFTFLRINGWVLTPDGRSAARAISSLYDGHEFKFPRLVEWLKDNARRL